MTRSLISLAFLLFVLAFMPTAMAACTYGEALLAFERGNIVRGQALMKMAARDGDQRAMHFLASYDSNPDQSGKAGKSLSELLLVLNSSSSMGPVAKN